MNVAIIGAGVSGILSLRHLKKHSEIHDVVVFEQRDVIGGLWAYTDKTGEDENGLRIHSSMYRECITNVPVDVMKFWDLDHKERQVPGRFMHWSEVLRYLNYYVDHFELRKHIKFNTVVDRVHPEVQENGAVKWDVQVRQVDKPDAVTETHYFDAVFVCNGAFSIPLMPDLPGLSSFGGLVMHSHDFRTTEPFQDKTVIVVGAGPSGVDIGIDISAVAKQVYLSCKHSIFNEKTPFPDRMKLVKRIKEVKPWSIILADGEEIKVDAIMLTTGYKYSFPFLSEACRIQTENNRLFPLYKHVVHVDFPSLFVIGVCKNTYFVIVNFLLTEVAVAMLVGKIDLPRKDEMLKDIEDDYQKRKGIGFSDARMQDMFPGNLTLKPYQEGILKLSKGTDCITEIPQGWIDHLDTLFPVYFGNPRDYKKRQYPIDIDWSTIKR